MSIDKEKIAVVLTASTAVSICLREGVDSTLLFKRAKHNQQLIK